MPTNKELEVRVIALEKEVESLKDMILKGLTDVYNAIPTAPKVPEPKKKKEQPKPAPQNPAPRNRPVPYIHPNPIRVETAGIGNYFDVVYRRLGAVRRDNIKKTGHFAVEVSDIVTHEKFILYFYPVLNSYPEIREKVMDKAKKNRDKHFNQMSAKAKGDTAENIKRSRLDFWKAMYEVMCEPAMQKLTGRDIAR